MKTEKKENKSGIHIQMGKELQMQVHEKKWERCHSKQITVQQKHFSCFLDDT